MDVHEREDEAASFVRRFLKHPTFDTQAKRMSNVARLSRKGVWHRKIHVANEIYLQWMR